MGVEVIFRKIRAALRIDKPAKALKASSYISCKETVLAADGKGVSVSDYVEDLWGQSGLTDEVMKRIQPFAANGKYETAVEIGPGTGRYMERTLNNYFQGEKSNYHFYEVADDWADWLEAKYGVRKCSTTGYSLEGTDSNWCDFIQAHGVFVYTPLLITCKYLKEIARVAREGGLVVFDICSEDCFSEQYLNRWLQSSDNYPVLMNVKLCDQILDEKIFSRIGDFFSPYGHGLSHYLIYQRKA